jgi:hypothetical protein
MRDMLFLSWFPLIFFVFHDFEEVIMAEVWYSKYKDRIRSIWKKKLPFGLDFAESNVTASVAIGVGSEYLFIFLVCLLSVVFDNYWFWYGSFVGSVIHMLVLHLGGMIKLRRYFPGIVTSAILFVPSIWILYEAQTILQFSLLTIVVSTVVTTVVTAFIAFAVLHRMMTKWARMLMNYARPELEQQV